MFDMAANDNKRGTSLTRKRELSADVVVGRREGMESGEGFSPLNPFAPLLINGHWGNGHLN